MDIKEQVAEYLVEYTDKYKKCVEGEITLKDLRSAINTFLNKIVVLCQQEIDRRVKESR